MFGESSLPAGFVYRDGLFSRADEAGFIRQFQHLPLKPFEFRGHLGNRRIAAFGFRYDYSGQVLHPSASMPDFLAPLREIASNLSGVPEEALQQALVSEYAPGAGIGWHRDKPMFETVVALSLGAPCILRLRQRTDEKWKRANAPIAARSGYVLRGEVRENWEHSIVPMEHLRYSVTFRSFRPDFRMSDQTRDRPARR
ncbi:MAG TPA: alpha-ketoglutarate-dependent dioxygenase AlkB [Rhizomicrobium sp.]|jgi:alkylated DNA repair dioxygenase AlkB|nr:alpha-ketoglutarate-dependent dioxygenase AlkB [Rhizomicrobium sp.]